MIRVLSIAMAVFVAAATGALTYAVLSDSQTASGTVNVMTGSPDLYICEPHENSGLNYECGPDDSAADEEVFEGVEDIGRGQRATYDLRLRNVGATPLMVTSAILTTNEVSDPGNDCPSGHLFAAVNDAHQSGPAGADNAGVFRLADHAGDDPPAAAGIPLFPAWGNNIVGYAIYIAPGQAEDVRLAITLNGAGSQNCDANVWDVTWQFDVG